MDHRDGQRQADRNLYTGQNEGESFEASEMLERFRRGDARVLALLMAHFARPMSYVARRYLSSTQDIEDAVQDAWVAFARAQHTITEPAALGGWLCITTSRAALTIATRGSRCRPVSNVHELGRSVEHRDDLAGMADIDDLASRRAVRDAIGRLEQKDRELITMLFNEQLSYADIVARTGRSAGSIGPTRRRAMEKLRRDPAIHRMAIARSA